MSWRDWIADKLGWFVGSTLRREAKERAAGTEAPPAAKAAPTVPKTLHVLILVALVVATSACAPFFKGLDRGLGGGPMIPDRPPVVAAPAPCCVAQGGKDQLEAPGRVCRENDTACWHDPADGCDSCWVFIPPLPPPTAAPTVPSPAPPIATPTQPAATPTVAPTTCMNLNEPPAEAVPIFTGQACRPGFVPVRARDGMQGCIRQWACEVQDERCAPGDDCFSPFRRIQASLDNGSVYRCAPDEAPGPEFICDGDRPAQEGYGRNITPSRTVIVPEGVDHDQPWKRASICGPRPCPPPPAPTPATPTPEGPRGSACTCQVICTAMHLGWNDNKGVPEHVVAGGHATVDITCRQAQSPGDQRGQPVDRSNGPLWCEPAKDPVAWSISVPAGVDYEVGGDGYRLDMKNLQAGDYRIKVTPRIGAVYKNGEPVRECGWGHNSSVSDELTFTVH